MLADLPSVHCQRSPAIQCTACPVKQQAEAGWGGERGGEITMYLIEVLMLRVITHFLCVGEYWPTFLVAVFYYSYH